jgi:hypothetical protein
MWELLPNHYPDCLQHLKLFGLFLYGRKIHWPCKKDARLDVYITGIRPKKFVFAVEEDFYS